MRSRLSEPDRLKDLIQRNNPGRLLDRCVATHNAGKIDLLYSVLFA